MGCTFSTILAAVVLTTALAAPAAAQETVNFASVSGRVTDPQGAVIRGATVTARHTETNVTRHDNDRRSTDAFAFRI